MGLVILSTVLHVVYMHANPVVNLRKSLPLFYNFLTVTSMETTSKTVGKTISPIS